MKGVALKVPAAFQLKSPRCNWRRLRRLRRPSSLLRLKRLDRRLELDHRLGRDPHALEVRVELRRDPVVANDHEVVVLLMLAAGAEVRRAGTQDLTVD